MNHQLIDNAAVAATETTERPADVSNRPARIHSSGRVTR